MTDQNVSRERVWHQAFGRPPTEIDAVESPDWLRDGAAAFAIAVLEGPFAGSEVGDALVEDLAQVVNALTSDSVGGDASPHAEVDQGLAALVEACLNPLLGSESNAAIAPTAESRAGASGSEQDASIRGLRSVLLRTRNGELTQAPKRFPRWVQDRLLDHALNAISDDVDAYTTGRPIRAKQLAVMLAANFAAFRSKQYKVRFINLLKQLCVRSEEYMDPFLRDLVLIAHVAELGDAQ